MSKKRQEVSDFQVKVFAERAKEHPKVFTKAVIEYHIVGREISEDALRRSIELSADSYCPAQAMLGKIIPLELKYFIFEGNSIDDSELVTEGKFS